MNLSKRGERWRRANPGRPERAVNWSPTPPPRNWPTLMCAAVLLGLSRGGLRYRIERKGIRTITYRGVTYMDPAGMK